jgi:3'(2'), 5'-bisphosphate nucleotidase
MPTTDTELARTLAAETGEFLLGLRANPPADRSLRDAADAGAHRLIIDRLAAERPDDVVFSEEAPDPRLRLTRDRVWIVDPLDGTKEYGDPPRDDWAVHIALWADGDLVAGAVAMPALGEVFATDTPPVRTAPVPAGPRIVVSRSRPPAIATAVAVELGGELLPMGSAGAKSAAVWRGIADAYVHTGGLHEWDAAAPVAVARAAGLHTCRIDGSPVEFNRENPYLDDLIVCVPELTDAILARTTRAAQEVTG